MPDSNAGRRQPLNLGSFSEEDRAKRSDFLARMSHELRAPLNSICGYAQLLDFVVGPSLKESHRLYLTNIVRSSAVLLEMVNDILDYAKIQSGLVTVALGAHDVSQLIEDAVHDMAPMAMEHGISIKALKPGSSMPLISADQFRTAQILRNLLSNAIKYNRKQGSVEIGGVYEGGGFVRIVVRDTGPGIPRSKLEAIFEPYNRIGAETGPVEGAGLGLAICKQLAEIMSAGIGCKSSPSGSEFWIDLPLANAQNLSSQLEDEDFKRLKSLSGKSILYVDDSTLNRDLLRELIAALTEAELTVASSGREALNLIKANAYDLAILDINLPDISGYDLLAEIQAKGKANFPVIALSAATMRQDFEKGMEAGFDAYVTKPFIAADLLRTISDALAAPAGSAAGENEGSAAPAQPAILVIEDEPFVRAMIVEHLESCGYNVFEAHNGYAGLTALNRCAPNLLVIDFAMPGLNGVQVAREARAKVPDLPIIVISGNVDPVLIEEIAGRNTLVLGKPFALDKLQDSVLEMLDAR